MDAQVTPLQALIFEDGDDEVMAKVFGHPPQAFDKRVRA